MNTKDRNIFLISKNISIKQAMQRMNEHGQKNLFIVNEAGQLLGALSDGDIRKWILSGGALNEAVARIYNKKPKYVTRNYKLSDVRKIMVDLLIESVPVVDETEKSVLTVLTWNDVFSDKKKVKRGKINAQVVIMAGGKGSRLDPFTKILPKPLIPIGDKPIIELIMDKFNEYGIHEFYVSVNHKAKMIKSYFEEMNDKYKIVYIDEQIPLGTAGSLQYLKNKIKKSFIITNCDILIDADCVEIVNFHETNNYDITMVVSCRNYIIPYGVCEIENGGQLKRIVEKPSYDLLINTGMYVINRKILNLIPKNKEYNMNELIEAAQNKNYSVGVYPISENSWTDIGQWEEYHKAIEKMKDK